MLRVPFHVLRDPNSSIKKGKEEQEGEKEGGRKRGSEEGKNKGKREKVRKEEGGKEKINSS